MFKEERLGCLKMRGLTKKMRGLPWEVADDERQGEQLIPGKRSKFKARSSKCSRLLLKGACSDFHPMWGQVRFASFHFILPHFVHGLRGVKAPPFGPDALLYQLLYLNKDKILHFLCFQIVLHDHMKV